MGGKKKVYGKLLRMRPPPPAPAPAPVNVAPPAPPPAPVNRYSREASPIPFKQYDKIMKHLNDGEYATIHKFPLNVQPRKSHKLRNALLLAGLGAGIGAMYHYRKPLMKLGQRAYNYASDKFHNLFNNPNSTDVVEYHPNPHNW